MDLIESSSEKSVRVSQRYTLGAPPPTAPPPGSSLRVENVGGAVPPAKFPTVSFVDFPIVPACTPQILHSIRSSLQF
jgi:hypothetical protein